MNLRRRSTALSAVLLCLLPLTGCAHKAAQPQSTDWRDQLPAPTIDNVSYEGAGGNERATVQIFGAYFNTDHPAKDYVITSVDLRNWEPAKKIVDATNKAFVAVVAHPASYRTVYLRIYGTNGHYSDPVIIKRL